ncbi:MULTISPECIES: iron-containing alcohol dehydrogenase [unclassified Novosphingobium]|uniref:iron-containing alcohol dehydrogenase n=1 Tax=unclassified Novosphingobium TaxID=2644732 RepID=UPI000EC044E9|nr:MULTISPECIES: iron-containing alcohol dehydrogenase [unclassified Novosphingobium]HCF25365.1 alcohol dehydrogenase [Novosphingobium sp.]HQV04118.1 iron-containing alcohol dehydrogenase [Novosphingobium sp.]
MAAIHLPRTIRIGGGVLNELPEVLAAAGLSRPLIVTDSWIAQCGILERVESLLAKAGIPTRTFTGVVPDPTVTAIEAGCAFLAEGNHDCVIGLGGGSPIDSAKMIAVLRGRRVSELKAPHQEDAPGLPIIAVPTTAGTGSEATRFTVITDAETDEKMLCAGLAYLPLIAVVDYELTLTKPARLTADTGIDSLVHAVEAYVSKRANPFADSMALSAMRLIWPNLPLACAQPDNRAAREALMLGALQGGIAFSNSSVALVHGMSRPIGAHFHVAHGLSNAMLMPLVTKWSAPAALPRYAQCARAMGVADAAESDQSAVGRLVEALEWINAELAVPTPAEYGIEKARWDALIPLMAEQALASGSPGNNPRVPEVEEVEGLYRAAWG